MKKIIIILTLFLSFNVWAQESRSDAFFTTWKTVGNGFEEEEDEDLPPLPGGHGGSGDVNAPLSSGLLILTALSAGYAIKKKRS